MSDNDGEVLLSGGNTSGQVVRIADTVRKVQNEASPTIHRLLTFLESDGFDSSPRFLGIDKKGREILSFLPGSCEITDTAWLSPQILVDAAAMLKNLHDITARFPGGAEDQWRFTYPDSSQHEVICHNDCGLYNLVVRDDRCCGIIDFDLAGPGPRLRDIAYAAYWLVPLSMHATDMKPHTWADIDNGGVRLKSFCESYGVAPTAALLDMVSEVLHHMADDVAMMAALGNDTVARLQADGHLDHWAMEALAFDKNRPSIEKNLSK